MQEQEIFEKVDSFITNVEKVIIGKHDVVSIAIAVLLSEGHLLMEDVPGMGKTMLAKALAKSFAGTFRRIQFTPDLLPSDVTGSYIYDQKTGDFVFRPGPIFANIVIADEINRGTPRTQSSLLEPMEEYQVTVDGNTFKLEKPFFLIATQNPVEREGTYFLPISQTKEEIIHIQEFVKTIKVDSRLYEYIVNITQLTRESDKFILGVSPRASLDLFRLSQAFALLEKRNYAIPDDVKKAAPLILAHRVIPATAVKAEKDMPEEIIKEMLNEISVPI